MLSPATQYDIILKIYMRVGGVVTCVGDRWRIGPTFVVIPVRASVFLSR